MTRDELIALNLREMCWKVPSEGFAEKLFKEKDGNALNEWAKELFGWLYDLINVERYIPSIYLLLMAVEVGVTIGKGLATELVDLTDLVSDLRKCKALKGPFGRSGIDYNLSVEIGDGVVRLVTGPWKFFRWVKTFEAIAPTFEQALQKLHDKVLSSE